MYVHMCIMVCAMELNAGSTKNLHDYLLQSLRLQIRHLCIITTPWLLKLLTTRAVGYSTHFTTLYTACIRLVGMQSSDPGECTDSGCQLKCFYSNLYNRESTKCGCL